MAFMDKLGQIANKVGDVAGDTLDYGKAKGKIVLEKGKVKDGKEALGGYVYETLKAGGELNMDRMKAFIAEIEAHMAEIAKQSGQDISSAFEKEEKTAEAAAAATPAESAEGDEA